LFAAKKMLRRQCRSNEINIKQGAQHHVVG
jgi:hypothetical protein